MLVIDIGSLFSKNCLLLLLFTVLKEYYTWLVHLCVVMCEVIMRLDCVAVWLLPLFSLSVVVLHKADLDSMVFMATNHIS